MDYEQMYFHFTFTHVIALQHSLVRL